MKRTSQTRLTASTILSLLLLLALAVGAQAAAAAHFSNGSAATTPAAGTEGRGGVAATSVTAVTGVAESLPGTQGRGGALLVAGVTTPAAGTAGRGGVAAFSAPSSTGTVASGSSGGSATTAFNRVRGGLPVPQAGNVPRAAIATGPMTSSDWITLGVILAFAAGVVVLLSAVSRRRTRRNASALGAYCSTHPGDPLCGAA
jgi:hypothetical protein